MNVNFFYKSYETKPDYEAVITSFSNAVARVIELPESIDVCIYPLAQDVYGGIDMLYANRIGLNTNLRLEEIPLILTHELIHVSQKFLGQLRITHTGVCYWNEVAVTNKPVDQLTYEEYENLPWEVDVQIKQTEVLRKALAFLQQNA